MHADVRCVVTIDTARPAPAPWRLAALGTLIATFSDPGPLMDVIFLKILQILYFIFGKGSLLQNATVTGSFYLRAHLFWPTLVSDRAFL